MTKVKGYSVESLKRMKKKEWNCPSKGIQSVIIKVKEYRLELFK